VGVGQEKGGGKENEDQVGARAHQHSSERGRQCASKVRKRHLFRQIDHETDGRESVYRVGDSGKVVMRGRITWKGTDRGGRREGAKGNSGDE